MPSNNQSINQHLFSVNSDLTVYVFTGYEELSRSLEV